MFNIMKLIMEIVLNYPIGCCLNSWWILQIKQDNREDVIWTIKLFERMTIEVFRAAQGWRTGVDDDDEI
jgi:hypothetical protein